MNTTEQPIILAGTTDSGTRYVQFWTESEKIAGREVAFCRAEMRDGGAYAPDWLTIKRGCPPAWVEHVMALFPGFFAGGDVQPTHTVTWNFSVPTFHPIAPVPVDGGLFDLEEVTPSTCYIQHQCRCEPCCEAHATRERNRQRQKAYGRFDTGLVDAEPVRQHVLALAEYGIGYKRIAELAGVGITGVRSLLWGRQDPGPRYGEIPKRVGREKAEKILAVQPIVENLGARQSVPATGTHRRVQALVARGWSISRIGRELGWDAGNFHAMLHREHVGAATHRDVAAAYERMWNAEPPRSTHREKIAYSRSVGFAKRHGWLPPLAWDDIDHDPTPERGVIQQGRVTGEELLEDIAFLLEGGESPEQVAALVGRKPATIAKLAERYGDRDIANTFGSLGKRVAA